MPSIRATRQKLRWAVNSQRRVSVAPDGSPRGRVLLSYQNTAVLSDRRGQATSVRHPSHGETLTMVRVWRELGYAVDVVNFHNRFFRPRRHYDVVIDTRWNLDGGHRRSRPPRCGCSTRTRLTTSRRPTPSTGACSTSSADEGSRLLRRTRNRGPDVGDAISVIGNDVTAATFAYTGKPLLCLPVATRRPSRGSAKDHDAVRARFLWLGSRRRVCKRN